VQAVEVHAEWRKTPLIVKRIDVWA